MTKRERRRHAVLVKTTWTKEWLAALDNRDFQILYDVLRMPTIRRKLVGDDQKKVRLTESEKQRRERVLDWGGLTSRER